MGMNEKVHLKQVLPLCNLFKLNDTLVTCCLINHNMALNLDSYHFKDCDEK